MVTLDRTGMSPLSFNGDLLAQVEGRDERGIPLTVWHDISIFRTESGRYVVAIVCHAATVGAVPYSSAKEVSTPDAVVDYLRAFDPVHDLDRVFGRKVPPDKLQELRSAIWDLFQSRVTQVLVSVAFADSDHWDATF